MPFTMSHPAVVVPLRRLRLPLSALVVGSISPDFIFFIYLMPPPRGHFSHTLPGLLLVGVPAGLAALWFFHRFLKRPLVQLSPPRWRVRLVPLVGEFGFWPMKRFGGIVAALLIGGVSHLVWDDLTHFDGRSVENVALLRAPVWVPGGEQVPLYVVLQYSSTVVGASLLIYWFRLWLAQSPADPHPGEYAAQARQVRFVWVMVLLVSLLAVAVKVWWEWNRYASLRRVIVGGVVSGVSAAVIATVLVCAGWQWASARRSQDESGRAWMG